MALAVLPPELMSRIFRHLGRVINADDHDTAPPHHENQGFQALHLTCEVGIDGLSRGSGRVACSHLTHLKISFMLRMCGFSPGWWKEGPWYLRCEAGTADCNVLT
ncbi:hypothetical protein CC86DRAFT_374413 [Ophiobolus disseminans]|uniref:Uncharacterized protein n=1 Tax=Ophiobolus disseminans TaxID=1469910 RepID=A0A6A6ZIY8_9PLEO|nr:hypothetical protein CC86DRAFT_374413 [Ophiobolus disseminans]